MNDILLFGAGKSATVLIEFLKAEAPKFMWKVVVADQSVEMLSEKIGLHSFVSAKACNIINEVERQSLITNTRLVISLLPPNLHFEVAKDCIAFKKHLLTASYVDDNMRSLANAAKENNLLFLAEMGLDPGIDHMSAMEIIDRLQGEGATITSFKSHCGGLVAPKSNNNPWQYKISWNPKNIVLAGKAGAIYKQNNAIVKVGYNDIFNNNDSIFSDTLQTNLAFYPNRDSLSYVSTYGLLSTTNFIRTTLRYPQFCIGWQTLIEYGFTNENNMLDTNAFSIKELAAQHFSGESFESKLASLPTVIAQQFDYLFNDTAVLTKGKISSAYFLQLLLEQKLMLTTNDADMVVMVHEFEYSLNQKNYYLTSELILEGENNVHTAMAKTVGLPLGIAASLLLQNKLQTNGLQIPISKEIYEPVLDILKNYGVGFTEKVKEI